MAAAVAALLGLATVVPAAAGPATTGPPAPSDDFCTAFSDYYQAQFVAALISGFAQIGEDDGVDEDEVRATFLLALSPKLVEITRDWAAPRRRCSARTSSSRCACTSAACRCCAMQGSHRGDP